MFTLVCLTLPSFSGCGIIWSTNALQDAKTRYKEADVMGARETATYEFTLGEEFLKKAREEYGYSDYRNAQILAERASSALNEARKRAARGGAEAPINVREPAVEDEE